MSNWQESCAAAAGRLPSGPFASHWFEVSQNAVNEYMHSVGDADPTHLDPEWARQHTPYGGTIAPGMWLASLLVAMLQDTQAFAPIEAVLGTRYGLNYGFDRVRFVSPTPVGARVRGRFSNTRLCVRKPGTALISLAASVEIEHQDRPALVAAWHLAFLDPEAGSTGGGHVHA